MCCLFGLIDYKNHFHHRQKSKLLSQLAIQCEVRGTDATGIAYSHAGRLSIFKRPLPAHQVRLKIPAGTSVVMGHTRLTTQGTQLRNENNHPFPGKAGKTRFALAHNGVLYNDVYLREDFDLPKPGIETDSYVAVQLIEKEGHLDFGSLKTMAEQVSGSFVFTILDAANNLYFVKGDNPLCLYHYPKSGFYLYASTEEILRKAIRDMRLPNEWPVKIPVEAGEILRIDSEGNIVSASFDMPHFDYYSHYYGWDLPYLYPKRTAVSKRFGDLDYLTELRSVAAAYGYTPEDIEKLLDIGYSLDDVSELIYCGEM